MRKLGGLKRLWLLLPALLLVATGFWALRSKGGVVNNKCAGIQETYTCYADYYRQLTLKSGTKAAFKILKVEYDKNTFVKSNCHQIVHVIGRATSEKIPDVPKAYNQGDSFCWSGFYHGVLEGVSKRIGFKNLPNKINDICASISADQKYSHYHYNCVHGLGHGMMFITDNELFKSLDLCDRVTDQWERESCYGGVFMENVMANVLPEHKTKYLKTDDPFYPCTAVDHKYRGQCYLVQPSHALDLAGGDFAKTFKECAKIEGNFRPTCYQSLGRDASGHTISEPQGTLNLCLKGPDQDSRGNCIVGAVKDFVFYFHGNQQASALCNMMPADLKDICNTTREEAVSQL